MELVFKVISAGAGVATIFNVIYTIFISRKVKKVENELKQIYKIKGNENIAGNTINNNTGFIGSNK